MDTSAQSLLCLAWPRGLGLGGVSSASCVDT
jgi:hypothetical protein